MPTATSTDRIEKEIVLKAPRARVWRALTNAPEFGQWFTQLKIVESGFDQIPLDRRAEAYRMNTGSWSQQLQNIARHLAERA